jgi:hypothetical protein
MPVSLGLPSNPIGWVLFRLIACWNAAAFSFSLRSRCLPGERGFPLAGGEARTADLHPVRTGGGAGNAQKRWLSNVEREEEKEEDAIKRIQMQQRELF